MEAYNWRKKDGGYGLWEGLKELLMGFGGWSSIVENEEGDGEVAVAEELFSELDKRDEMADTWSWDDGYGRWFQIVGCFFLGRFWKVNFFFLGER